MKFSSNIEEVIERLKSLTQQGQAIDFSEALSVGVNAAIGAMKNRVFNTGKGAGGVSFGKYVGKKTRATKRKYKSNKKQNKRLIKNKEAGEVYTEYQKFRLSKGRQVKYKDLELTGDLRSGIKMVVDGPLKVVAAIPNKELFKIAGYQEKQISKIVGQEVNIFGLSDKERELLITNTKEALIQIYARIYST